jgi:hypothetical protein
MMACSHSKTINTSSVSPSPAAASASSPLTAEQCTDEHGRHQPNELRDAKLGAEMHRCLLEPAHHEQVVGP